jgi:hypothetical protein
MRLPSIIVTQRQRKALCSSSHMTRLTMTLPAVTPQYPLDGSVRRVHFGSTVFRIRHERIRRRHAPRPAPRRTRSGLSIRIPPCIPYRSGRGSGSARRRSHSHRPDPGGAHMSFAVASMSRCVSRARSSMRRNSVRSRPRCRHRFALLFVSERSESLSILFDSQRHCPLESDIPHVARLAKIVNSRGRRSRLLSWGRSGGTRRTLQFGRLASMHLFIHAFPHAWRTHDFELVPVQAASCNVSRCPCRRISYQGEHEGETSQTV